MLDLRTRMRQGGGCTAVAAPGSEDFLGSLDTHEFDLFLGYGLTDRIAFELAAGQSRQLELRTRVLEVTSLCIVLRTPRTLRMEVVPGFINRLIVDCSPPHRYLKYK